MEFLYKNFYASFGLIICIFLLVNCSETNDTKKELASINKPPPLETKQTNNHNFESQDPQEIEEVKPPVHYFASIVSASKGKTEYIEYKERRFIFTNGMLSNMCKITHIKFQTRLMRT